MSKSMSIFTLVVLALIAVAGVKQEPEIRRYLKLRSM